MKLPSAEEYLQIVDKKNPGTLATLFNHKFVLAEDGKTYLVKKSRNHIVFKSEHLSRFYAVRFFLHDDDELFRRYHQVEAYINPKNLSWKVPFRFMDEEYYPALLMDWIDGLSFSEYLDLIINDPPLISKLQKELISLSRNLESDGIGHGNLNMQHIRFVKQHNDYVLKLIDYDSMFIPSLREKDSFSVGTSGFQHPMRLASDFSETIDRFSIWIFVTALESFKVDPSLWKNATENGFDKNAQILFTYRDIAFSKQSATFEKLRGYNSAQLNFYCDRLISFCDSAAVDQVEAPRLYEEKIPSVNTNQSPPNQPQKIDNEVLKKQAVTTSENTTIPKTVAPPQKQIIPVEKKLNKKRSIQPQQRVQKEEQNDFGIPPKRKRKISITPFIIVTALILSVVAYLAWNKQSKKEKNVDAFVPSLQTQRPTGKNEEQTKETVFTSSNITQFLFQLYQSYNKRDISAILTNYADSVHQYYDAGSMSKNKLSDLVKNLFIKPAYYECHPDLTTLKFNALGDSCKLSILINETIKADKISKTENYSSKIEYTVDTSFKIMAEKNIE
jgi:hypothetical protein